MEFPKPNYLKPRLPEGLSPADEQLARSAVNFLNQSGILPDEYGDRRYNSTSQPLAQHGLAGQLTVIHAPFVPPKSGTFEYEHFIGAYSTLGEDIASDYVEVTQSMWTIDEHGKPQPHGALIDISFKIDDYGTPQFKATSTGYDENGQLIPRNFPVSIEQDGLEAFRLATEKRRAKEERNHHLIMGSMAMESDVSEISFKSELTKALDGMAALIVQNACR